MDKKRRNQAASVGAIAFAALLVAAAVGLLLHGGGRYYFGAVESDLTAVFYPYRVFVWRWFSRGVFPLWDPHIFGGVPVLEMQQTLSLNPVRLFASWFFTPRVSLLVETAGYVVVAAMGSWFALRRLLKCSAPASLLGLMVFVFGGLFTIRVGAGHITVLAALCWWPLAVGLTFRLAETVTFVPRLTAATLMRGLWTRAGVRRPLLWLAATNAMVLLAGGPQYVVYLFWTELLVVAVVARTPLFALVALGISWALALCLSAPQWLPALWYLPFTGRGEGSGSVMQGAPLSDLLVILIELLMPHPLGDDLQQPHLFQKAAWETITYPGIVALVLIGAFKLRFFGKLAGHLWSRLRKRSVAFSRSADFNRRAACMVILLLGVYLMTGGWLPGFSSFREPIKARAILALGMAMAAALEFDALLRLSGVAYLRRINWLTNYAASALVACVIGVGFCWLAGRDAWFVGLLKLFPSPLDAAASKFYNAVMVDPQLGIRPFKYAALWVAGGAAVIAVTVILLGSTSRTTRVLAISALLGIAAVDLCRAHWIALYAHHPYDRIELRPDLRSCLEQQLAESTARNELPWRVTLPPQLVNGSHFVDGLYETGGYDPLMPARGNSRVVIEMPANDATGRRPLKMVHQAIGRRIDCTQSFAPLDESATSCPCAVIAEASIVDLERQVTAGAPQRFDSFGPRVDNLNYVAVGTSKWLTEDPPQIDPEITKRIASIHVDPSSPDGHGTVAGETLRTQTVTAPNELSANLTLNSPALLLYRTTWLPGWQVCVDGGTWESALCANRWMVCVPVDKGERRVTFRYTPVALWFSVALAAVAWFGIALLLLLKTRFREGLRP